jgi:hypothetical protein
MKIQVLALFLIPLLSGRSYAIRLPAELIRPDDPRIRYEGRWDFSDPLHPRNSWPGTAVRLAFTGRMIGVRMDDSDNYYNVTLDGRFVSVFHGDRETEADYILAGDLDDGPHTLVLSKRNISFGPPPVFAGVLLTKGCRLLDPGPDPGRRIEFIGDSFTAAEGNEATAAEMPWEEKKPVTNIDRGFARITADRFAAALHATCRSGIGMVCDWRGDTTVSMPGYFDRGLMESPEPLWNFGVWIPQLAVVCLGLNDHSGLKSPDGTVSAGRSERFRRTYAGFLDRLRSVYPGVKILAVAADTPWIRENVTRVVDEQRAAGRKDVFYAQFDHFSGGYVANGHPDAETHRKIAQTIIRAIEGMGIFGDGR